MFQGKNFFLLTFLFLPFTPLFSQDSVLTLKSAYYLALTQEESILIAQSRTRIAQEELNQTLSSSLPELFFRYSLLWQDQTGVPSGIIGTFNVSPQREGAFTIRKNVFNGYREWKVLEGGKSLLNAKRYEEKMASYELFLSLTQIYYGILLNLAKMEGTKKVLSIAETQKEEMMRRVRVGKNRPQDLTRMELVVENLKGDLLELKKEIAREKEALFYFIRTTAETLKEPETLPSFITFPVEFFLEKIPSRPDILAMKENIRFQGIEVDLAKGEFLPFVDLQGNYYVDRTGIRKEVDWDAMISLTFPLFSFGKRKAGVLKAKESLRLSELKERQLYEQIKREVREKYAEVLALQDLEKKRENVLRLAEKQVKDNEKDLFRGLITTLEFLDSLNGLYQAELLYILTRLQKQKAILELYVISGFSPEEIL